MNHVPASGPDGNDSHYVMKTIETAADNFRTSRPMNRGGAGAFRVWLVLLIAGIAGATGGFTIQARETMKPGGPVKVQIVETNGGYQLYINHEPFYIKGAGMESGNQEKLAAYGGNSFRTWSTDDRRTPALLERAVTNHLYVTMGLSVGLERQGFDYDDQAAVARQLKRIKREVLKYKDHPALIIWAIGNELNLNAKNPKVWDAVNDISKMIHQVDPNHLTLTPLAGFNAEVVQEVKRRAPDLDLISFQMYADIVNLPHYLGDSGWTGPYLVTEWGATGHWEVKKTDWGAPIENDSTTKADYYESRFERVIAADRKQCLGSYVFLWGNKQERTPTWYGMFLESGEETAAVDVMRHLWTGEWPSIRSPKLSGVWLDGKTVYQNIHLKPGQSYPVKIEVTNYAAGTPTYVWDVMEESRDLKTGGDHEGRPASHPDLVTPSHDGESVLKAPSSPGSYRLFVYVLDGQGHAAHANIPFKVDQTVSAFRAN